MANFTTSEDLISAALDHAGELSTTSAPISPLRTRALRYLNRAHHEILSGGNEFKIDMGEPWTWAKSQTPGILQLDPPYETGTISVTKGSTAATLSSASTDSLAGRYLKLDGRPEVFRISAHTGGTDALTLDGAYTDDTGSGLSYKLHALDYSLSSGIMRLIEPMRVYRSQDSYDDQEGKIYGIALEILTREYPLDRLESGTPIRFAKIGEVDGSISIRMNRSANVTTRVEYEFIPIPSDLTDSSGSIPLVPREYRIALSYMVAYWLMLDKEDSRSDVFFRLSQAKLQAMVQERRKEFQQMSKNFGKILPREDDRDQNFLRTTSGLRIY